MASVLDINSDNVDEFLLSIEGKESTKINMVVGYKDRDIITPADLLFIKKKVYASNNRISEIYKCKSAEDEKSVRSGVSVKGLDYVLMITKKG